MRNRSYPGETGRSIRDNVAQKPAENPLKVLPKMAKEIGDEFRFRILSMDPDHTRRLEIKRTARVNQHGTFNDEIHEAIVAGDPEEIIAENDLTGLIGGEKQQDNTIVQKLLTDMKSASKYRIPVWAFDVTNAKGKVTPIEELRFIELTWGQFQDILKLEEDRNADLSFDEKTGKPNYDIVIRRNAKSGQDTYEIFGIQYGPGKGRDRQLDENYGVSDKEALGDECFATMQEQWGELQDAMDEFQTAEQVRYLLGAGGRKPSLANRPTMPGGDDGGNGEPEVEPEAETTRTRGRRGGAAAAAEPEAPKAETNDPAAEDTSRNTGGTEGGGSGYGFQRRRRGVPAGAGAG